MWYITTTLEMETGTDWRTTGLHVNALVLASMQRERKKYQTGQYKYLCEYLDHLLAVIDVLDRERLRTECDNQIFFHWKEDGKSYAFSCVRGEVILVVVLLVQHFLAQKEPEKWQLAVRLLRWVALPQLNAWIRKDLEDLPPSCSEHSQRELLTMGLLRLQVFTIHEWEHAGSKGKMGMRLAKWAMFYARYLARTYAHMQPLCDELEGLMWLFANHIKDPVVHQRLLARAKAHFEKLAHTDRVKQLSDKVAPGYAPLTSDEAHALMSDIVPLSVCAQHEPLKRPYTSSQELRELVQM